MKKTTPIFIVLMFMLSSALMAQPFCQWTKGYGGIRDDAAYGIVVDASGNVFTIGSFNSPNINFGTTTLTNVDNTGSSSDIFITKSDSCGTLLWAKKVGNEYYSDFGTAIAVDKDGNVYVTGRTYSYTLAFGGSTDTIRNNGSGFSGYIAKYSTDGNILWAKGLTQTGTVIPTVIAVDKNQNVYLSGYYASDTVWLDSTNMLYGSAYSYKSFLVKYNTSGNVQWAKDVAQGSNYSFGLAVDTLGNIFTGGAFYDSIKIGNIELAGDTISNSLNAYLVKYNSSGNAQWAKTFGATYHDEIMGMTTDKAGNVYISGYFSSDSVSFDNTKLYLPNFYTQGVGYVAKYNTSGNALWAKRIGGFKEDYAQSVITDPISGDLFVTGYFRSDSIQVDNYKLYNSGGIDTTFDAFVVKFNSVTGGVKWAKSVGGLRSEYVEDIAVGTNGVPYIVGDYSSPSVSIGGNTATNHGNYLDVFITNDISRNGIATPQLCMVTVDTTSTNAVIYWDKTPYTTAENFIVYREVSTNVFKPIAIVPVDSLSEVVDTVRTKYFPNTGNPNVGTYRYKLQYQDKEGNYSLLSPYHNTIYIVHNGNGQFTWNPAYTIEGAANPVNSYVLMRDNTGNGNWTTVGSVSGTQNTISDPSYSSYPNGKWRIETSWAITCTPTRASINTTRSNIKSSDFATGVKQISASVVDVYPNPANDNVTIQLPSLAEVTSLSIINVMGQTVYNESLSANSNAVVKQINTSNFAKGIYTIEIANESNKVFKKLVIE